MCHGVMCVIMYVVCAGRTDRQVTVYVGLGEREEGGGNETHTV